MRYSITIILFFVLVPMVMAMETDADKITRLEKEIAAEITKNKIIKFKNIQLNKDNDDLKIKLENLKKQLAAMEIGSSRLPENNVNADKSDDAHIE